MPTRRDRSALLRLYDPAGMIGARRRFWAGRPSTEVVVTAHGWLATRGSMDRLNAALNVQGYQTINWTYPHLRGSIRHHAKQLSELLGALATESEISRIHLVTHSMGGIIARSAIESSGLEQSHPEKCGRLVMMAPPNHGSWLTRLPLGPLARWLPQMAELSENDDSLVNQLPSPVCFDVAVIAAQRDFVVSVDSTHLDGESEHQTVATTHQRLVNHPQAIALAVEFVQQVVATRSRAA